MPFKRGSTPWNRGLRGLEAGWTAERRQWQAQLRREWLRDHPEHPFGNPGGPDHWKTGPDPDVRRLRYRFLRARAQARFWSQEWRLTWDEYLEIYRESGEWGGRGQRDLNLTRIDTDQGWWVDNVRLLPRGQAMRRRTRGHRRIRPQGLGSKQAGRNWRRGGHGRDDR